MTEPFVVANMDIAEMMMWAFTLFFFGLIAYLRREDRREGYPLETDTGGLREPSGGIFFTADPKTFKLANGHVVKAPVDRREPPLATSRRTAPWPGAPIEPVGDPMKASVGPGAYAQRADTPDMMWHGDVKIVPLRAAPGFRIDKRDAQLIGYAVIAADGREAGTISDVWVDRSELLIRYLEVALESGKKVLVPFTMTTQSKSKRSVFVSAVKAAHFEGAPTTAKPDQVTFLEEEKIVGYFGAGYLYASKDRQEPFL